MLAAGLDVVSQSRVNCQSEYILDSSFLLSSYSFKYDDFAVLVTNLPVFIIINLPRFSAHL